jgi:TATA-binding protein-associated factor Taf7
MYPAFHIIEPTTQAKLQLKASVEFFPGKSLPVFAEVQAEIRSRIEGKKMAVEAAAIALIALFKKEYAPNGIKVKVEVINNNTFFPIAVAAEYGFDCISDAGSDDAEKSRKKGNGKKEEGTEEIGADEDSEDEDDDDDEDDE